MLFTGLAVLGCGRAGAGDVVEPPRHSARVDLRIGSVDDSATMLTDFRKLLVGAGGDIYTLHRQESQIRVHDPEGRPVRTIGRAGEGPGEFRSPGNMGFHGDTLWVFDDDTYRFTWYHATGALIESRAFPVDIGDRTHTPPRPRGLLRDGTIRGRSMSWSQDIAEGRLTHQVEVTFDTTGAVIDTMVSHSVVNSVWMLHDPASPTGLRMFRPQPFDATEIVVVSEDRPEIVVVDRSIAEQAERAEFRVTKLTLEGDTLFSVAFAYVPRAIPEELPDSLVRAFATLPPSMPPRMAAGFPPPGRALELARASLFQPEFFPPVSMVVLGRDGSIWLRREDTGSAEHEWWILDEHGRLVGAVLLPRELSVMAAEQDRIWGLERDDLDVPYIVRYVVAPEESLRG